MRILFFLIGSVVWPIVLGGIQSILVDCVRNRCSKITVRSILRSMFSNPSTFRRIMTFVMVILWGVVIMGQPEYLPKPVSNIAFVVQNWVDNFSLTGPDKPNPLPENLRWRDAVDSIHVGDVLLEVNGIPVNNKQHADKMLKKIRQDLVYTGKNFDVYLKFARKDTGVEYYVRLKNFNGNFGIDLKDDDSRRNRLTRVANIQHRSVFYACEIAYDFSSFHEKAIADRLVWKNDLYPEELDELVAVNFERVSSMDEYEALKSRMWEKSVDENPVLQSENFDECEVPIWLTLYKSSYNRLYFFKYDRDVVLCKRPDRESYDLELGFEFKERRDAKSRHSDGSSASGLYISQIKPSTDSPLNEGRGAYESADPQKSYIDVWLWSLKWVAEFLGEERLQQLKQECGEEKSKQLIGSVLTDPKICERLLKNNFVGAGNEAFKLLTEQLKEEQGTSLEQKEDASEEDLDELNIDGKDELESSTNDESGSEVK